jgi:hypothetical protein
VSKHISDVCISFTHLVCIGLDGCNNLHVPCSVSSNGGHILLWLRKVCIWLRKGYVGHHKIWWGHGCTTPPCLHWYTTVVTRQRRGSSQWWDIILLCTSFLGRGRTFSSSSNPLFFSSLAQEVLPLTNLLSPQEKVFIFHPIGANLLWPL